MSLNVGSNGGVKVEVAATQGGRRVAIYRGPGKRAVATCCTRSLRLGRTLRLVLAGHSGPGRRQKYPASFRRVSDFDTACCHTWDNLAESLRPAHAGHSGLHHKSQQKTWQIFPGDSTQMLQDGKAGVWFCVRCDFPLPSKEIPLLIVRLSYTQRKAKKKASGNLLDPSIFSSF